MPLIRRRRVPLPLKHMPQMPSTVITDNLRPHHPKRTILVPLHRAGDRVEVRRPAAPGLELVRGFVEGCVAAGAGVYALFWVVGVVFACVGWFGAFLAEDSELCFLR